MTCLSDSVIVGVVEREEMVVVTVVGSGWSDVAAPVVGDPEYSVCIVVMDFVIRSC